MDRVIRAAQVRKSGLSMKARQGEAKAFSARKTNSGQRGKGVGVSYELTTKQTDSLFEGKQPAKQVHCVKESREFVNLAAQFFQPPPSLEELAGVAEEPPVDLGEKVHEPPATNAELLAKHGVTMQQAKASNPLGGQTFATPEEAVETLFPVCKEQEMVIESLAPRRFVREAAPRVCREVRVAKGHSFPIVELLSPDRGLKVQQLPPRHILEVLSVFPDCTSNMPASPDWWVAQLGATFHEHFGVSATATTFNVKLYHDEYNSCETDEARRDLFNRWFMRDTMAVQEQPIVKIKVGNRYKNVPVKLSDLPTKYGYVQAFCFDGGFLTSEAEVRAKCGYLASRPAVTQLGINLLSHLRFNFQAQHGKVLDFLCEIGRLVTEDVVAWQNLRSTDLKALAAYRNRRFGRLAHSAAAERATADLGPKEAQQWLFDVLGKNNAEFCRARGGAIGGREKKKRRTTNRRDGRREKEASLQDLMDDDEFINEARELGQEMMKTLGFAEGQMPPPEGYFARAKSSVTGMFGRFHAFAANIIQTRILGPLGDRIASYASSEVKLWQCRLVALAQVLYGWYKSDTAVIIAGISTMTAATINFVQWDQNAHITSKLKDPFGTFISLMQALAGGVKTAALKVYDFVTGWRNERVIVHGTSVHTETAELIKDYRPQLALYGFEIVPTVGQLFTHVIKQEDDLMESNGIIRIPAEFTRILTVHGNTVAAADLPKFLEICYSLERHRDQPLGQMPPKQEDAPNYRCRARAAYQDLALCTPAGDEPRIRFYTSHELGDHYWSALENGAWAVNPVLEPLLKDLPPIRHDVINGLRVLAFMMAIRDEFLGREDHTWHILEDPGSLSPIEYTPPGPVGQMPNPKSEDESEEDDEAGWFEATTDRVKRGLKGAASAATTYVPGTVRDAVGDAHDRIRDNGFTRSLVEFFGCVLGVSDEIEKKGLFDQITCVLKTVALYGLAYKTVKTAFSFIPNIISAITMTLFGYDPFSDARSKAFEVAQELTEQAARIEDVKTLDQAHMANEMWRQFSGVFGHVARAGIPPSAWSAFAIQYQRMAKFRQEAARIVANKEVRTPPVCVMWFGGSGTGKTSSMQALLEVLSPKMAGCPFNATMLGIIPFEDQWEGYYNQPFMVQDEFGSLKDEQQRKNSMTILLRAVNTQPYPVHMAFEQKGCVYFDSKLICLTTNLTGLSEGQTYLEDANAFGNRIDLAISPETEHTDFKNKRFLVSAGAYAGHDNIRRCCPTYQVVSGKSNWGKYIPNGDVQYVITGLELANLILAISKQKERDKNVMRPSADDMQSIQNALDDLANIADASDETRRDAVARIERLYAARNPPTFKNLDKNSSGGKGADRGHKLKSERTEEAVAADPNLQNKEGNWAPLWGPGAPGYQYPDNNLSLDQWHHIICKGRPTLWDRFTTACESPWVWGAVALLVAGVTCATYWFGAEEDDEGPVGQSPPDKNRKRMTGKTRNVRSALRQQRLNARVVKGGGAPTGQMDWDRSVAKKGLSEVLTADLGCLADVKLCYEDGTAATTHGFFVAPNTVAIVGHGVHVDTPEYVLLYDRLNAVNNRPPRPTKVKRIYWNPNYDIAFLELPKSVQSHKTILHRLRETVLPEELVGNRIVLAEADIQHGTTVTHAGLVIRATDEVYRVRNKEISPQDTFAYNLVTAQGTCGRLVYTEADGGWQVIGFHAAGNSVSEGYAVAIDKNLIEHLLQEMQPDPVPELPDVTADLAKLEVNPKIGNIVVAEASADFYGFPVIAEVAPPFQSVVNRKNKIVPTPYFECGPPSQYAPAALAEEGGIDPLDLGMLRSRMPDRPEHEDVPFKEEIIELLMEEIPPPFEPRVYTEYESVLGVEGLFTGLSLNTSEGYPWSLGGKSNKSRDITVDHLARTYELSPRLRDALDARRRLASEWKRFTTIAAPAIKMELLKNKKVVAKRSRLIKPFPVDHTIEHRRFCMDFALAVHRSCNNSSLSIGMDVHGHDWEHLYHRINSIGEGVADGDFSSFDASIHPVLAHAALEFINRWYGGVGAQERTCLLYECLENLQIIGNKIFRTHGGNPSGQGGTDWWNAVIAKFCLFSAAAMLIQKYELPFTLRQLIAAFYGDDHLAATPRGFPWPEMTAFVKEFYGMTITSTDKVSELMMRDVLEVSYLSRRFVWRGSRLDAPLDRDRVWAILYWWTRGSDHKTLQDIVDAFFFELTHHGEEYYEEVRALIARHPFTRVSGLKVPSWRVSFAKRTL